MKKMMIVRFNPLTSWLLVALCSLMLSLVLLGCDESVPSSPAPTPQPTSAPGLITYIGNGFSIGFPVGWNRPTSATGNKVVFSGPSLGVPTLSITLASNPHGRLSADTIAMTALPTLADAQPVSLPSTVMVGGDRWIQKAVAGTATINGASTKVQFIVLADNHPANAATTMSFVITYDMTQAQFASTDVSIFQPMLHTFKFTSSI